MIAWRELAGLVWCGIRIVALLAALYFLGKGIQVTFGLEGYYFDF